MTHPVDPLKEIKALVHSAGTEGVALTRLVNLTYAVKLLIEALETHTHNVHPANGDMSGPMHLPCEHCSSP